MNVGKRLRERREYLGLTQEELAQALGVTTQYISAIEQQENAISVHFGSIGRSLGSKR